MIKDINELKELILWAKSIRLKSVKVADISFELSDLALSESLMDVTVEEGKPAASKELSNLSSQLMVDTLEMSKEELDDLLYHSTR